VRAHVPIHIPFDFVPDAIGARQPDHLVGGKIVAHVRSSDAIKSRFHQGATVMPRGPVRTALFTAILLAGCAQQTMSPTAIVMPAKGKPFEVFATEQSTCMQFAGSQVNGPATMAGLTELGTIALGAGLGVGVGSLGSEQRLPRDRGYGDNYRGENYRGENYRGENYRGENNRGYDELAGATGGVALASREAATNQPGLQARYNLAYVQCMVAHGNQVPAQPTAVAHVARSAAAHHVASPAQDSDTDQPSTPGGNQTGAPYSR
jgi:hypothetical protein